jgi:hypothetical protein
LSALRPWMSAQWNEDRRYWKNMIVMVAVLVNALSQARTERSFARRDYSGGHKVGVGLPDLHAVYCFRRCRNIPHTSLRMVVQRACVLATVSSAQ